MTEPIHGRCLICFEDKPFDVFRTGCGLPPNDVVGVCKDCTAAAVAARDARRAAPNAGDALRRSAEAMAPYYATLAADVQPDAGDVETVAEMIKDWWLGPVRLPVSRDIDEIATRISMRYAAREAQLRTKIEALRDFSRVNSDAAQQIQAIIDTARKVATSYHQQRDGALVSWDDIGGLRDAIRIFDEGNGL